MPIIFLETYIDAPIEKVFDLARSIDFHVSSTKQTQEEAIAGKTQGLIELHETVTWQARHLGVTQKLTSKITEMQFPNHFTDVMLKGAFSEMKHIHEFKQENNQTLMTDLFYYKTPLGLIGRIIDFVFLTKYMKNFLIIRNAELKRIAESEEWKQFIQ